MSVNLLNPLFQAITHNTWSWAEVAKGQRLGDSVVENLLRLPCPRKYDWWAWMAVDSFILHYNLKTLGSRYIKWEQFFKYSAIILNIFNLQTIVFKHHLKTASSSFSYRSAQVWNYTPKLLAIAQIIITLIEFPKRPMKAMAGLVAGIITYADSNHHLSKESSFVWKKIVPYGCHTYLAIYSKTIEEQLFFLFILQQQIMADFKKV